MTTHEKPLYVLLAEAIGARARLNDAAELGINDKATAARNAEWSDIWTERAESLVREHLPSGSGFDSGTILDLDASTESKLVFVTSFHHMDVNGFYDGWTPHVVTIRPDFVHGFEMKISGRDRNGIKELIAQSFEHCLRIASQFEAIEPAAVTSKES